MPAATTADALLALVRKSQLVEQTRLTEYLRTFAADLPREPKQLAARLVKDGLITYFQSNQLLLGKWNGYTLGNYRVLELLGSGGNGQVYLCVHQRMRRLAAVKVLPPSRTKEPIFLERFFREARASASLDHPNIVHAFDTDQSGKLHYLVMEFVDGMNLQTLVTRRGALDCLRAAHYMAQTALGLQCAYENGWVHRDIKPANLLLDRSGVVKILDMGLARLFDDPTDAITQRYGENSVFGSTDYLAPEQAVDGARVDIRADLYSLGATFYFVLTGHPPFPDGSAAQKLLSHQVKKPESIRKEHPEVPQELAAVVEKLLEKDPDQRYQTPMDVVEALSAWTSEQIPAPADSDMPRYCPVVQKLVRESRSVIVLPANLDTPLPKKTVREEEELTPVDDVEPVEEEEGKPVRLRPRRRRRGMPKRELAIGACVTMLVVLMCAVWRWLRT
jgi:serine/threonine protein kinase